jgi:hypothetical protein
MLGIFTRRYDLLNPSLELVARYLPLTTLVQSSIFYPLCSASEGFVVTSNGIQALEPDIKSRVLEAVRNFDAFNESNGSRRLHNYGQLEVDDLRIWFIIDSPDVTIHYQNHDPNVDARVLWILFPWEF